MAAHRPRTAAVLLPGVVSLVAAGLTAVAPPAAAADPFCTATWSGGTGTWDDAARWSGGVVPSADDHVCVIAPAGGPAPDVSVRSTVAVSGTTLTGATLRVAAGRTFATGDLDATRAVVAGRGTVSSDEFGVVRLRTSRLIGGVSVRAQGSLYLAGVLTLAGGSRVDHGQFAKLSDLADGLQVRDGDGHPDNHLTIGGLATTVTGTVTIGVRFDLDTTTMVVTGRVSIPRFDPLGADGTIAKAAGYAVLETAGTGTVTLARSVTAVGRAVALRGGAFRTPDGSDALADLARVDGALALTRPLTLPRALEVRGAVSSQSVLQVDGLDVRAGGAVTVRYVGPGQGAVVSPSVVVDPRGRFSANSLSGRLNSRGFADLSGSRLGALVLTGTASTTAFLDAPVSVDRAAVLGGDLRVKLPLPRYLPADGARVVLLTAGRPLTGRFASVTAGPPQRGSVTLEYTPTQVVAVYHAPTAGPAV